MSVRSARVRDFMSGKLVVFKPETDVLHAIQELVEHGIAGAPVVNDFGDLVGMLSELDCMRTVLAAAYHGDPGGPVSDYMVEDVDTVDANMNIVDLAELFLASGYRRYPVLNENRLVGQISRRDVLRALNDIRSRDGWGGA